MTRRLEAGPALVTLGALLLLVSLFMDWFEPGITAWQAFEVWDVVLLLLALGCLAAGIGLMVPDVDVVDRRWLPVAVAAVAIIAASQIIDPPPAAAGQDPEAGAWLALGAAALMCVGGVLTFGRLHFAITMEGRDPRRRVPAVDQRPEPGDTTDSAAAVPASDVPTEPSSPVRSGRLFARDSQPQPAEQPAATVATQPMAPAAGDAPPEENKS